MSGIHFRGYWEPGNKFLLKVGPKLVTSLQLNVLTTLYVLGNLHVHSRDLLEYIP